MTETVATQMFATIPTCDNNHMIAQVFSFEHPQDHHPGASLAIIAFYRPILQQHAPTVMRRFGELFVAFECLERCQRGFP